MPDSGSTIAELLIHHVRDGTILDLIPDEPHAVLEESEMLAWGPEHDIDASQLRDLIRGRTIIDPDPHGVQLRGARIRGRLDLDHVTAAVQLTLLDCLLDHGLTANAASFPALTLHRCRLRHPTEPALRAVGLRIHSSMSLSESIMDARTFGGTIRLTGAHIGGQLVCGAVHLTNADGPAISAVGLHVGDRVFLDKGFSATSSGSPTSTIRLSGAHLGQLVCQSATLTSTAGPALAAAGMHVADRVFLDRGFTAHGTGPGGTIRLPGTHIGGRLLCHNATVTSSDATGPTPQHRWNVDGLTYTAVPEIDPTGNHCKAWLDLLCTATPTYAAQPYQQLAAAYRAAGHDREVREILIAQRRNQIRRGTLARADRWWARLTGVLLGYGYQPWRALLYLTAVLCTSVALTLAIGQDGGLAKITDQTPTTAPAATSTANPASSTVPCTATELISKGLDLGTPFLPSTGSSRSGGCEITPTPPGDVLTISRWLLQLLAWALAALFVAGLTGLVRKT